MVFVPQAANWLFLLFSFQISSSSAFYAEKVFAPIQLLKGNDHVGHSDQAGTGNDVMKSLMDEGDAAVDGGQAVGQLHGGERSDDMQSDKRRLGSALNIGRGRGHLQKVNGKRVSEEKEEGEFGERLFQLHGKTAVVGQLVNSEQKEGDNNNEQVEEDVENTSDVDRRNIGSAMNLIKVRKNDILRRMSPLAAASEGDPSSSSSYFEEERERRRLGSAMNLKKVTQDRMKSRLIRE